jgi:hypothetical protein
MKSNDFEKKKLFFLLIKYIFVNIKTYGKEKKHIYE